MRQAAEIMLAIGIDLKNMAVTGCQRHLKALQDSATFPLVLLEAIKAATKISGAQNRKRRSRRLSAGIIDQEYRQALGTAAGNDIGCYPPMIMAGDNGARPERRCHDEA
jgi:hypothetical protein